jgi:hypothetical protein
MSRISRPILDRERDLLRALAKHDPECRASYLRQIDTISSVEDWNDGSHSLTIEGGGPYTLRVAAVARDEDGFQVDVMLFGAEERIRVLEIVRPDGQEVKLYPKAADLEDVWDYRGNPRPEGW